MNRQGYLTLTRRVGQRVLIDCGAAGVIEIELTRIEQPNHGQARARIAFRAPPECVILREELTQPSSQGSTHAAGTESPLRR